MMIAMGEATDKTLLLDAGERETDVTNPLRVIAVLGMIGTVRAGEVDRGTVGGATGATGVDGL